MPTWGHGRGRRWVHNREPFDDPSEDTIGSTTLEVLISKLAPAMMNDPILEVLPLVVEIEDILNIFSTKAIQW